MFSLFFPWLYGAGNTYEGQLFQLSYIGLIPLLLAAFSFGNWGKAKRPVIFLWIYSFLSLGLVYSIPPMSLLSRLPVLDRIASVKFAFFGLGFSIAMLAGFGIEKYFTNKLKSRHFALALAAVSGIALLSLALGYRNPPEGTTPQMILKGAWFLPMLLFIISAGVAFYGILSEERELCAALLIFLALVNLLHLYAGFMPQNKIDPAKWEFSAVEPQEILKPIIEDQESSRFLGLNMTFHQNLNLVYGISDLRVFEGIYPRSYVQALGEIEGFSLDNAVQAFFQHGWSFDIQEKNLTNPLINSMGIKYLLSPEEIKIPGWRQISAAQENFLYKNENVQPRARIVRADGTIDFSGVRITKDFPDRVELAAACAQGSTVVLADQYAPGWRAYNKAETREVKITANHGIFREIKINPQDCGAVFVYKPWGFRIGLYSTLSGIFALLAGFLICRKVPPKNLPLN